MQMIQHVHGGCKQDALVSLAGFPSDDAGEECFPHAGVSDEHKVRALAQEREIEQTKNTVLGLDAALLVVAVESIDAGLRLQTRGLEAAFYRTAVTGLQFHIGQQLERGEDAEIARGGISDRRLDLSAHRFQVQLLQFLFERDHRVSFQIRE